MEVRLVTDDAPALEASDREQFSIPKLLKQHIVEVSSQHP